MLIPLSTVEQIKAIIAKNLTDTCTVSRLGESDGDHERSLIGTAEDVPCKVKLKSEAVAIGDGEILTFSGQITFSGDSCTFIKDDDTLISPPGNGDSVEFEGKTYTINLIEESRVSSVVTKRKAYLARGA